MAFQLLFWHWIVFGVVLISLEILVPTFTLFWFGCAAIVVGFLVAIFPEMAVEWQVVLWAVLSLSFAIIWFKVIRPLSRDKTHAGLALETLIGEVGLVIHTTAHGQKGKLRFPAPVVGADEWMFYSEETLQVGDKVKVVNISGNSLAVKKID